MTATTRLHTRWPALFIQNIIYQQDSPHFSQPSKYIELNIARTIVLIPSFLHKYFFYLNNGGRIVTDLARNANVLMQFFQFHSYKSSDLLFFFNWTLGRGPAHYAQPVGDLPSNTSHDTIDWAIRSKPDERNRESCLPHHEPTSSSEKNCALCDRNPRMTDCYVVTHSPALTSRRGRQHDRSHKPREIRAPKTCWNIFVRHE